MPIDRDRETLRRLRLRIIILALIFVVLAMLAWVSVTLTGTVHAVLWMAIVSVGLVLGFAVWTFQFVYTGRV